MTSRFLKRVAFKGQLWVDPTSNTVYLIVAEGMTRGVHGFFVTADFLVGSDLRQGRIAYELPQQWELL